MNRLYALWLLRDLRSRWIQVLATALILAVGAGAFAGMRSLKAWRLDSLHASLAQLRSAQVRVDLAAGETLDRGELQAQAERVEGVDASQERLVAPSQVATGTGAHAAIVPARLVGIPGSPTGAPVDAVSQVAPDAGGAVAAGDTVLDWNFASFHQLPSHGELRLAGYGELTYVATGLSPQYLLILSDAGVSGAESSLAVVYLPLSTAQKASGHEGQVNQLLVRGVAGTSERALAAALREQLHDAFPRTGFEITTGSQEPAQRMIAQDAANDQKTNTLYALLLVAGAALAAFMLVTRVVDSQRREIGIGMALGAPRVQIARRPLTLGAQIGVLAALLGVPFGLWLAAEIKGLMTSAMPLPVDDSSFPAGLYAVAVAIAVLTPLAAAVLPVRRALKMRPVDAIATVERGGGKGSRLLSSKAARTLPGGWNFRLAVRNLLRAPRRSTMTIVGLAVVMTAVVSVLAMVDSIGASADAQRTALLSGSPNRLEVALTSMHAPDARPVQLVRNADGVVASETRLSLGTQATANGRSSQLLLSSYAPDSSIWQPALASGSETERGVLLSARAADDLAVEVGDHVTLSLPSTTQTVKVSGIHANPIAPFAYVNTETLRSLGLGDTVNEVDVVPAPGSAGEVQRALFGAPGVASVTSVRAEAEALENAVDEFTGAIRIVVVMTLGLGLLVAFTAASLTLDERRREFATLFAFGVSRASARRMALWENLTSGLLGTGLGVLLGVGVGWWTVHSLLKESFPEVGISLNLTAASISLALCLGIGATALATIFAFRRVARMDVPGTLRFRE